MLLEEEILTSLASSVKNGPSTVPSVAPFDAGWFIESTSADSPTTSESKMNSCLKSVQICPVFVRNWIAVLYTPRYKFQLSGKEMMESTEGKAYIHSSVVSETSLAKSCKCRTNFSNTNFCLFNHLFQLPYQRTLNYRVEEWRGRSVYRGFSQSELIAWTFSVMFSGERSVKSGNKAYMRRQERGEGQSERRGLDPHIRKEKEREGKGRKGKCTRSMLGAPFLIASATALPTYAQGRRMSSVEWDVRGRRKMSESWTVYLWSWFWSALVDFLRGRHSSELAVRGKCKRRKRERE